VEELFDDDFDAEEFIHDEELLLVEVRVDVFRVFCSLEVRVCVVFFVLEPEVALDAGVDEYLRLVLTPDLVLLPAFFSVVFVVEPRLADELQVLITRLFLVDEVLLEVVAEPFVPDEVLDVTAVFFSAEVPAGSLDLLLCEVRPSRT